MRGTSSCFLRAFKREFKPQQSHSLRENVNNQQRKSANESPFEENVAANIISNYDFSDGLRSWHPNCCYGYVASVEPGQLEDVKANSGKYYAVVSKRTECWQGLEQDITSNVSAGATYTLAAYVHVSGDLQGPTAVKATLKLVYTNETTNYLSLGRTIASKERWEKLDGKFSLESMPKQVVFYLEGPSSGVDILIDSVVVSCFGVKNSEGNALANIILNHDFSGGMHSWCPNSCHWYVAQAESSHLNSVIAKSGGSYAIVTNRKETWQGLEQDITGKVSTGSTYRVSAYVRVWNAALQGPSNVLATLRLEYQNEATSYLNVGRALASTDQWEKLEGMFSLDRMPNRMVFYLEGPSPGVDLLIDSVTISCSNVNKYEEVKMPCFADGVENIILNPRFQDGLNNWFGRGCKILPNESKGDGKILPLNGKFFASATERTQSWNGIQQEITCRVQRKLAYEVTAIVRIFGNTDSADVRATL